MAPSSARGVGDCHHKFEQRKRSDLDCVLVFTQRRWSTTRGPGQGLHCSIYPLVDYASSSKHIAKTCEKQKKQHRGDTFRCTCFRQGGCSSWQTIQGSDDKTTRGHVNSSIKFCELPEFYKSPVNCKQVLSFTPSPVMCPDNTCTVVPVVHQ